ncbi:MAG: hypothetical protein KDD82_07540 [Planctomycetes bacterium]|nr:hypothetical protein [Planctomycetota bacterium]
MRTRDDAEAKPQYCAECAAWRPGRICTLCGIDLETGKKVTAEELEASDVAWGALDAPSTKAYFKVLARQILPSLPGGVLCGLFVFLGLAFHTSTWIPGNFGDLPGRLLASFTATLWLIERTRAARSHTPDWDPIELGGSLFRALLVFPLLAGLSMNPSPWAYWVAAGCTPLFPLLLGAYSSEDPRELSPANLVEAFRGTTGYLRITLVSALGMAAAIFALGYKEGAVSWRAPLVALAITAVGTVVGLARRGAEHIPDYSD